MTFRMLGDWIPGLRVARSYQRDWLGSDLRAGLSVAAVAVPTGIAYISGQLGKLFGFQVSPQGFFRLLGEFMSKLGQTHWLTAVLGLALFVLLRLLKRLAPRVPAPLVAVVVGIAAVYLFQLDACGVSVIGTVPAGFPVPSMPFVNASDVGALVHEALGIVVISFCSAMLTARSFAAKHHYEIDANRDFMALGLSNIASGISQGFVISGADSRTRTPSRSITCPQERAHRGRGHQWRTQA